MLSLENNTDKTKRIFVLEEHFDCKPIDLYIDYTHVRAYHACRPLDIKKYLSEGIQVPSKIHALNEALARIHSFYVSEEDIKKQFNENWKDAESQVFLNLNKQELLTDSGHYLIYGSEFLNTLATWLGCKDCLKNSGIPTIFYCDIPIENIKPSVICEIENAVVHGYIDDFTITVGGVLPCEIVDYEHPLQKIPDPYIGGTYSADYQQIEKSGFKSPEIGK